MTSTYPNQPDYDMDGLFTDDPDIEKAIAKVQAVHGPEYRGVELTSDSGDVTVDPSANNYKVPLTENITVGNPASAMETNGRTIRFVFVQDGTGGWTVAYGDKFFVSADTVDDDPDAVSTRTFVWLQDGWYEVAATTTLAAA